MTTKGIIFSAPMVRALLAGTKTQTRRLLADAPRGPGWYCDPDRSARSGYRFVAEGGSPSLPCSLPYAPGDRLYVREAWHVRGQYTDTVEVGYRAHQNASHSEYVERWPVETAIKGKGDWPRFPKYGPSIHMPRWASRLWLSVTEVRVQRLQDISEADAIAEGIDDAALAHFNCPIKAYAALWNHLHGAENETSWEANPWIVAVSFDVHHGNIDRAQS